jgi:hypothetical protein
MTKPYSERLREIAQDVEDRNTDMSDAVALREAADLLDRLAAPSEISQPPLLYERGDGKKSLTNAGIEAMDRALKNSTEHVYDLAPGDEGLREALRPLADIPIEEFDGLSHRPDDRPLMAWNNHQITIGDVRRARAALTAAGFDRGAVLEEAAKMAECVPHKYPYSDHRYICGGNDMKWEIASAIRALKENQP